MSDASSDPKPLPVPSGRLARLGKLGSMTAGIAGNMAVNGVAQIGRGKRPSMRNLLLTPGNISRVADQLAQMRGAAMKIGQLMSMDTGDVLPPELATIMARLRDNAHFMPPEQLKNVLNSNWPGNWRASYQSFDVRPIAAASIGQVHRARLKEGRELAIKVQYPGVAKSIDSDVANVGVLMRMSGLLPKGFELAPYLEEGRKQLHQETDYLREAEQLKRFGAALAHDPRFVVPEYAADWSTKHILTMSYVSGKPIEKAAQELQDVRDRIAHELIDLTLMELFELGFMQTDPNFANYQFKPETGQIVLFDFGATRTLDPEIVTKYRALLHAGLAKDTDALGEIAVQIGFISPDTKDAHKERIIRMMQMVFEALTARAKVDFADTVLSRKLQQEGMILADDGFIPPLLPVDVLLLQRKFGGVFLLAARLGARVDVAGMISKHLSQR